MKKTNTKIGDVFSVKIDDKQTKYFQLIAFDLNQLNSDVIRAFKTVHFSNPGSDPDLGQIIKDEVEFYAHCVTKAGLKMGLWDKVGNIADTGKTDHILFRDTDDYGKHIAISKSWWVWRINGEQKFVGKLEGENRKSEIGVVFPPAAIVGRLQTGKYNFKYPDYE